MIGYMWHKEINYVYPKPYSVLVYLTQIFKFTNFIVYFTVCIKNNELKIKHIYIIIGGATEVTSHTASRKM